MNYEPTLPLLQLDLVVVASSQKSRILDKPGWAAMPSLLRKDIMGQSLKEASRTEYAAPDKGATIEQLSFGLLQRIADATEAMANEYSKLLRERDMYAGWYRQGREQIAKRDNTIRSLKGHITKLKRKQDKDKNG